MPIPIIGKGKELERRKAQREQAIGGRQKAAAIMRQKTIDQGIEHLGKCVRKHIMEIVPSYWRKIAEYAPPTCYYKFWTAVLWVTSLPHRAIHWFVFNLFIKTGMRCHKIVWKMGAWSETMPHPSGNEWLVRVKIYRWFKLRKALTLDVRNGFETEIEPKT